MEFIKYENRLYPISDVKCFGFHTAAQDGRFFAAITWKDQNSQSLVWGQAAIDLAMRFGPQVLEGNPEFKFAKRAWMFHNLVAHPVMQILALFGLYKLGLKIHDATIPRPLSKV